MRIPTIHIPDRRLFTGVAIGVLVGVLGVGAVTAASSSPAGPNGATGASGPTAGAAAKPGIRLGLLKQAIGKNFRVNVTATSKDGTHNVLYVRGAIALSATSVTVTLPDNTTQTFKVDSSTVVREKGEKIDYSDLENGERAMVFGTKNDDGSYTAKLIRCVKEPATKAAAPKPSATP